MSILQGFPTPIGMAIVPGGPPGPSSPIPGIDVGDTPIDVRHVSAD